MPQLPPIKRFLSNTGVRIYRIPCQVLPELSGRIYLLLGAGPPTLIDSGSGEGDSTSQILAGIDTIRQEFGEPVTVSDIRRVLVTHGHYDHIGGLSELLKRTSAEVGVHPLDRRWIVAWDERAAVYLQSLRRFFRMASVEAERAPMLIRACGVVPGRVKSVPATLTLREQEPLDGLQFLHIPGHSAGHVAIVVGNVLLCGDHILPRTVPQQWPECILPYTGLGHYLESLGKISRLEGIELALGGHEPPIEDLSQRITEIRGSHRRRLDRLLDILGSAPHPLTIREATERMYSHQKGFQEFLALTDVGARIEYLDQRGKLQIANLDEIERDEHAAYRYRPA